MTRIFEPLPIVLNLLGCHGPVKPWVKPAHDGGNAASRRDVLRASGAIVASGVLPGMGGFTQHARAQAVTVEPAAITPRWSKLLGRKESCLLYRHGLPVAKLGRRSRPDTPGSACASNARAERVFQRIGQEMESRIHAVDVVNSADAAHLIVWKRNGCLILSPQYGPPLSCCVLRPDGLWVTTRVWLLAGLQRNLVRPEDAPKLLTRRYERTRWWRISPASGTTSDRNISDRARARLAI
jgi:iron(III) transport system substrate-binding protein